MFERLILFQKCEILSILFVSFVHFMFLIYKRCLRNQLKKEELKDFFLEGYKRSLYGEIIKYLEIVVLIIFPSIFHVFIVSSMFYRSYNQTFQTQLNWETGIRIYTGNLLTIVFCILFFRLNKITTGSFKLIFLFPEQFSSCDYVLIQFKANDSNINNGTKLFKLANKIIFQDLPKMKLCNVLVAKNPLEFSCHQISRYFIYNHEKYWLFEGKFIWSRNILAEEFLSNFQINTSNSSIKIFDHNYREKILELVGTNSIGSMPLSYFNLIFYELASIINIIRIMTLMDALIYSFIVWPLCWSVITFYTILWSIIKHKQNSIEIHRILTQHDLDSYKSPNCFDRPVIYFQEDKLFKFKDSFVFSKELCPGMIVFIDKVMRVPADLLLLSGSLVVDESCLTGEATPQNKIGEMNFDFKEFLEITEKNKNTQLYAGSQIIEVCSKRPSVALVTRTGSNTLNGNFITNYSSVNLNSSYLFKKENFKNSKYKQDINWNFKIEIIWFICFLYGIFISLLDSYILSFDIGSIFFIVSSIIYIIPFWSTTSMSIAYNSTIKALIKNQIITTNPAKFTQLRLVDTICFDKTGTITMPNFSVTKIHIYPNEDHKKERLIKVSMATCNNLSFQNIEFDRQNTPLGSKLELSLFKNSDYCGLKAFISDSERLFVVLKSEKKSFVNQLIKFQMNMTKPKDNTKYSADHFSKNSLEFILSKFKAFEVVRRYPFDEVNRSQCVIVKNYSLNSKLTDDLFIIKSETMIFVKGAAERISDLTKDCYSDKVNFRDWSNKLMDSQIAGSYILGFCYKIIDDLDLKAETFDLLNLNKSFIPLGLVELHSPIRSEAKVITKQLIKSRFHCSIITGDNINSTILVAKELGLISDEFVVCIANSPNELKWRFHFGNKCSVQEIRVEVPEHKTCFLTQIVPGKVIKNDRQIAMNSDAFKLFLGIMNSKEGFKNLKDSERTLNHQIFLKVLLQSIIFARFTPDLKAEVVRLFEIIGKTVLAVGDGSNDVIALREANVGVLLTDSSKDNFSIAPFMSNAPDYGLNSVMKLIVETRGLIFSYVSMYLHIVMLGIFFVTCKTLLLWQSQAMIPAMAWLFIDIFCTLIPLLLLSLSRPKEYFIQRNKNDQNLGHSMHLLESGLSKNSVIKTNEFKFYSNRTFEHLYTIPDNVGNQVVFVTSFISLFISIIGLVITSYRLVHHILPLYGINPCYNYNLQIPVHLWHKRQDNIESASAWCYMAFQIINQIWPNWIRTSIIIEMKKNVYLVFWNILMNLFIIFCIWTSPCIVSCILRINCDEKISLSNKNVWFDFSSPFYGQYKNNIFPLQWRFELTIFCFLFLFINLVCTYTIKLIIKLNTKKYI